jgi:putative membrane protein
MRSLVPLAATAAAVLAVAGFARPAEPALDDPTIVAIYDAANTFDIEAGNLALQRSTTKAVTDLASQFVHDHTAVRQQGRDLATKLGVKPTPPKECALCDAHTKAMAHLKALSGPAFDKAYADHEVEYHQAVIDAINGTLLPAIKNAELKALVEKVAPAFQAHLLAAKALQKKVGSASASAEGH